jgi:tetratricopeptide (TPR) repeat protein
MERVRRGELTRAQLALAAELGHAGAAAALGRPPATSPVTLEDLALWLDALVERWGWHVLTPAGLALGRLVRPLVSQAARELADEALDRWREQLELEGSDSALDRALRDSASRLAEHREDAAALAIAHAVRAESLGRGNAMAAPIDRAVEALHASSDADPTSRIRNTLTEAMTAWALDAVRHLHETTPLLARARQCLAEGAIDDALALADTVVQLSGAAEALLLRAEARWARGDRAEAIKDASRAIGRDAKNLDAQRLRGTWRAEYGELEGALSDLVRYVALAERLTGVSLHSQQATAAFERPEVTEARRMVDTLLRRLGHAP